MCTSVSFMNSVYFLNYERPKEEEAKEERTTAQKAWKTFSLFKSRAKNAPPLELAEKPPKKVAVFECLVEEKIYAFVFKKSGKWQGAFFLTKELGAQVKYQFLGNGYINLIESKDPDASFLFIHPRLFVKGEGQLEAFKDSEFEDVISVEKQREYEPSDMPSTSQASEEPSTSRKPPKTHKLTVNKKNTPIGTALRKRYGQLPPIMKQIVLPLSRSVPKGRLGGILKSEDAPKKWPTGSHPTIIIVPSLRNQSDDIGEPEIKTSEIMLAAVSEYAVKTSKDALAAIGFWCDTTGATVMLVSAVIVTSWASLYFLWPPQ